MGEEDEYAVVARSKLKLKDESGVKKKKKKKKDNKEKKATISQAAADEAERAPPSRPIDKMTPAEKAFKRMQEKMQKERIRQKAEMTHKQRVEKFNQHLDSLTEHFDIPKVSWTK